MKRRSKQRDVILRILRSTKSHPTAEWIYDEARKEIPSISLGTVYRNLKMLGADGEILQLDHCSTFTRYDGNALSHYHFRCDHCHRVFDVDLPLNPDLDVAAARQTGFRVASHFLEFKGLCKECGDRRASQTTRSKSINAKA